MPTPPTPHPRSPDSDAATAEVAAIIERLKLQPHPEGGWYRETWRSERTDANGRSVGTAIHFLMPRGSGTAWHRIDADEIWHHYAGSEVELRVSADGISERVVRLGGDLAAGSHPQFLVPAGAWFMTRPVDGWALCGCTVCPGFEFSGFEMAPPGWSPGGITRP